LKYLLDTNILSEPGRKKPDLEVLTKLAANKGQCATSAISWHELQFGIQRMPAGKRRTELELLASAYADLPVLPYDKEVASLHARVKTGLEQAGRPMPETDGQIAATAEAHGLTLVTRNTADFKNYPGLKLENWFTP
jgi:tRNA(fMet)-specific endonuclease VapC